MSRLQRWTFCLVLAALVLAGCNSKPKPRPPIPNIESFTAEASTTTSTTINPVTVQLDKTVWFTGLKVTLGSATLHSTSDGGLQVDVDAKLENEGADQGNGPDDVVLASHGQNYNPSGESDVPNVPGNATGKATFAFQVDQQFSFDDAVLTFGTAEFNQAVVPFAASGELVDLQPVTADVAGAATGGALAVKVNGAVIRADIPYDGPASGSTNLEMKKDTRALTLKLQATGHMRYYDMDLNGSLFLKLPDGTTIGADYTPNVLVKPNATLRDLTVRFTVDAPTAGQYALVVRDTGIEATKGQTGSFSFRLP